MVTSNYTEAVNAIIEKGHGLIEYGGGLTIKGSLFDIQSKTNDPDGIGYISIMDDDGYVIDVYKDEFEALLEVW